MPKGNAKPLAFKQAMNAYSPCCRERGIVYCDQAFDLLVKYVRSPKTTKRVEKNTRKKPRLALGRR
jgi:hypothetical protein